MDRPDPRPATLAGRTEDRAITDPRILPAELIIGDVITSDLRRDFTVTTTEHDESGTTINRGRADQAFINVDQTITIRPRG